LIPPYHLPAPFSGRPFQGPGAVFRPIPAPTGAEFPARKGEKWVALFDQIIIISGGFSGKNGKFHRQIFAYSFKLIEKTGNFYYLLLIFTT